MAYLPETPASGTPIQSLHTIFGNSYRISLCTLVTAPSRHVADRFSVNNNFDIPCRSLSLLLRGYLTPEGRRVNILIDTGVGAAGLYSEGTRAIYNFKDFKDRHLVSMRRAAGLTHEDIDYVVLTHFHFDHAGGLLSPHLEEGAFQLLFPNARFIVSRRQFETAKAPHPVEYCSFDPRNSTPWRLPERLESSGKLILIEDSQTHLAELGLGLQWLISSGHSQGMLVPIISSDSGLLIYGGDILPGVAWVHHANVRMGEDLDAYALVDEKLALQDFAAKHRALIHFGHDAQFATCRLQRIPDNFHGMPRYKPTDLEKILNR